MGQVGSMTCPERFNVRSYLRAARVGDLQEMQHHLGRRNSDVNATNMINTSAMHLAAKEGHMEIVRELLHQNACVNQVTQKGNTPLHIAAMHGQTEIASLLIANGADLNVNSKRGYTPLYLAVMENHLDTVSLLLESGADHTLGPEGGTKVTPLQIAELQGHDEIAKLIKQKTTWADVVPNQAGHSS